MVVVTGFLKFVVVPECSNNGGEYIYGFFQINCGAYILLNWLWCLNFVKSLVVPGFSHVGGVCFDFNK